MLERIDRLMTGMRTVSDSVAHDLRSPLTHLRNRIEQALREGQDTDDYRKALRAALSDTDRVLTMFNALMTVARAEADMGRQEMELVDLGQVAAGVVELYEPLVEERGMEIAASIVPDAMVRGHRQLLAQAIANLVDNAIKYSPSGERIALTVAAEGAEIRLSVADSGPGISPDSREQALGRFVRLAGRETPGYGLGLSLVAAVAQLHRATLLLEDNTPGLRAVLVLPRA
jgi:signal transduction histidine kinase